MSDLGSYVRCPICERYDWQGRHTCGPRYECRLEWDGDDDWTTIYGRGVEDAATRFAEYSDCNGGEYSILRAGEAKVFVREPEPLEAEPEDIAKLKRWTVWVGAESVPQYHARVETEGAAQ